MILALKVSHLKKPLSPGQTGMIGPPCGRSQKAAANLILQSQGGLLGLQGKIGVSQARLARRGDREGLMQKEPCVQRPRAKRDQEEVEGGKCAWGEMVDAQVAL